MIRVRTYGPCLHAGGRATERLRGYPEDKRVARDPQLHESGGRVIGGPGEAAVARPRQLLQRLLPVLGDDPEAMRNVSCM